jgi:hypothetical protein
VSHITEISKATQWKPGQSGNLNRRPVGTRQAFSAGFLRDLAEVWSEEGRETMVKTARTNPAVFFATCARLIPNDVRVTFHEERGRLASTISRIMAQSSADRLPGSCCRGKLHTTR